MMSSIRKTSCPIEKRVTFAANSDLIVTSPKTERELKSVWYSKEEMKSFKSKAGASARRILITNPTVVKEYIKNSFEDDKPDVKFSGLESVCGIEHMLDDEVLKM